VLGIGEVHVASTNAGDSADGRVRAHLDAAHAAFYRLTPGHTYQLDLFRAQRHATSSNFHVANDDPVPDRCSM